MALSAGSVEIRLFAELARLQSDMKKANKVVEDAMGGIQKTVRGATAVFNNLAGAFGAAEIIKIADDYKRFDAQLKLATKSVQEYGQAYNNVIRIGRTAQSDINAIGVLYARLNNNLRDFNVTQNQVADVTETISLALRTNNATVQETNSVMLQLSQSFGSGKLNGQEFLAVAEGAPMLLRQLATSLKRPYGALKDLSAQGKITREDLLKAWSDPAYIAALRQQVKEVGTVTSAITVLMNNLKQYVGEADKATGSTKALSGGIILIADNINTLVSGAIAYGIISLKKWAVAQYEGMQATSVATTKAAQQLAFNSEMQALNAEKSVATSKLKQDMLKLEAVAESNKQAAIIKSAEAERAAILQKIQYNKETLVAIQTSRAEVIASNQLALSRQNEAIRTLEATRNAATLSGNLYYQRQAEEQLSVAIAKRNVLMTELAVLGRQQANVNAQITASTIALQKAEQSLNATRTTGAVSLANNASLTTRIVADYDKAKTANDALTKSVGILTTAKKGLNAVMAAFGGPVGIAISGIILFGDKLLEFANKIRGVTPELKKINDQIERNNKLRNIGVNADDPFATERESIAKTVAEVARLQEMRDRVSRMGKNAGVYMMFSTPKEKIAEIDAQIEQARVNISATMKSIIDGNNAVIPSTNANAEEFGKLSEKLKTAKELAAEYAQNQRLIMIEGNAAGLSQSEILEKLALLKEQYDIATGATKASKEATKDAAQAEKERAEGIKQLVLEQKAFLEAQDDARQAVILTSAQENEALSKEIEKTQERIDLLNMGEDAQNRLVETRLQDAIATAEQNLQQAINNEATQDAIKFAQDYLFTLKERLELQKKLTEAEAEEERIKAIKAAEKERVKANKEANDKIEDANDRMYKNLARSITDSVVRGFENGLSFIDNFKQAVTNAFKSFFVNIGVNFTQNAMEQVFGNITKGIFGSIAGGFSTEAMASDGALGALKSGYDIFKNGLDATNLAFQESIANFGNWVSNLSSSSATGFGGAIFDLGQTISNSSELISKALPYAGSILKLVQGDVKGAAFTAAGTALGSALGGPIGGAIGSFLGGAVGGLFGGSKKLPRYYTTQSSQYSGGVFTSNAPTTGADSKGLLAGAADPLKGLNAQFSALLGGLLSSAGLSDAIKTSSLLYKKNNTIARFAASFEGGNVNYDMGGKNPDAQLQFNNMVEAVLGTTLVEAIKKSKLSEGIKALFDGLVKKEEVNAMVNASIALQNSQKQLADRFGLTVSNAAMLAKETQLTGEALTTFITKLAGVAGGFKTVSQQIVDVRLVLENGLNGTLPETVDSFDSVLKSFDTTTEAGRGLFLQMFNLRDSFVAYKQAIDGVKSSVDGAIFSLLSPSQQLTKLQSELVNVFASVNLTVPKTTQELINLGSSIDYTTVEGLNLASVFPTLVSAFTKTKEATNGLVAAFNELDINRFTTLVNYRRAQAYMQNGIPLSSIPSYDVGTDYVPNDGLAMIHKGEKIIPAGENGNENRELIAEVRQMRQENSEMKDYLRKLETTAKNTETILRRVSLDGNSILVTQL